MKQPVPDDEGRTPLGVVVYREAARPWTSVWLVLAALVGLFALDRFVVGSRLPIGGWVLVIALVVGVYAGMVYAARSARSLILTTDELWVGDEILLRNQIVGALPVPPRGSDLPVLGWPTGMPRMVKGIVVRLADEQDVVIPTRKVGRLETALGVAVFEPKQAGAIRAASGTDLPLLADIDSRAEMLFGLGGYDLPEMEFDTAGLERAAAIFVVEDPPVAFIWLREVDGMAYVEKVSVTPSAMRTGVGTALLEHACEWARDAEYPAITLTTYADVPWNGPFFRARGFAEFGDPPPALTAARQREAENGLDAVGPRIVLRRELQSGRVTRPPAAKT